MAYLELFFMNAMQIYALSVEFTIFTVEVLSFPFYS